MKKIITLLLLIAFLNVQTSCFAAVVKSVKVKNGLVIPIAVNEAKSSKNVTVGEKVFATIDDDVKSNGVVIFKKGDKAFLNVADVQKSRFWGNPGEVLIINGKAYDANGEEHSIEYYQKITGEEKTYPKVLGAISIFFLFPLALFGFVKGGDAKINPIPIDVSLRGEFDFVPGNL